MTNKSRLLLGLLLSAPGMAYALGLGDIRLGSGLNQPLSAEIELVGATPEELAALRAGLASRESFARYGLDRPAFLSSFTFKVKKDSTGRNVLEVRSVEALTEPFITFLVEVNWPRGRLIREYTVLLDPPTFEEKATPAPAIAAPSTGEPASAASGAVTRPAPVAEAAPAASAPTETPSAIAGGEYRVVAGDTLSGIARRAGAATTSEVNRLMIAIYRANPDAFAGNINRLNRGAVLRIPGGADLDAVSSAEAASEVRRQMAEWRGATGGAAAAGADAGRLRLVPPSDVGAGGSTTQPLPAPAEAAGAATQPGAAAAPSASERKRLLELRNEELARLQAQKGAPATPAQPAPGAEPAPVPAEGAAATPPAAEAAPAAEPEPKPVAKAKPKPGKKPAAPPPESSFFGDNLLYIVVGGLLLLLAGLFGFKQLQKRRDAQVDDALRTLDRGDAAADATLPTLSATARIPREDVRKDAFVVEEDDSGEFQAPPEVRAVAPRAAEPRSTEDTLSSETGLNLEQSDPLAEADFHMAYGLYDQAADIVKLAMDREPDRRDLRLKLLEVYFVWGNKDAFMDVARELGRTRDQAPAGEWDKVAIMGRQIAPDEPLFAGSAGRGAAADVDLELAGESGAQGVDLELLGGDDGGLPAVADSDVDLDLGQALAADSLAATGESPALDADGLDFALGDESGSTTREMAPRADSPTVEQPMLGGTTREIAPRLDSPTVEQPGLGGYGGDSPTVESPALATRDDTLRSKIASATGRNAEAPADATSELSLDDLGFDMESLGATAESLPSLEATDHPSDAPTMVAGLDERSRAMLARAEGAAARADLEPTRESPRPDADDELTQLAAAMDRTAAMRGGADFDKTEKMTLDAGDTGAARVLGSGGDLDLDLDELAKALENDTIEQPRRDDLAFSADVFPAGKQRANGAAHPSVDLDVGTTPVAADREPTVTERINVDDLALPELEPVTLSEVGTKLDLARAYMDMGDPDGARSILQEVLSEGSASQKTEAQRLIETLPG